jgi:D-sedoheptulose 7-phosphate isomerase
MARFPDDMQVQLREARDVIDFIGSQTAEVEAMADRLADTLRHGGTVFTAGNGGSALAAQHFAAELIGRFQRDRRPFPSLSLTTDSGVLTAIANDYGYESVFSRQLGGLGRVGDALIVFTTSGESRNLIAALKEAKKLQMLAAVLSGGSGGAAKDLADHSLIVPSKDPARIQEGHLVILHGLVHRIDAVLTG